MNNTYIKFQIMSL